MVSQYTGGLGTIQFQKEKEGEGMTALEVWEKYKHLDTPISDGDFVPQTFWESIIVDLWSAVKNTAEKGKERRDDAGDKLPCGFG